MPNNSLDGVESTRTAKNVAPKLLVNHSLGEPDIIYRVARHRRRRRPGAFTRTRPNRCASPAPLWIDFAAALANTDENLPAGSDRLERFTPDAIGGISMPIPSAGLLSHLGDRHKAFTDRISNQGINPYTRPTHFGSALYRRAESHRARRWIASTSKRSMAIRSREDGRTLRQSQPGRDMPRERFCYKKTSPMSGLTRSCLATRRQVTWGNRLSSSSLCRRSATSTQMVEFGACWW